MKKFLAIIFLFSFIQPCYAYIDPATGSMLFSVFLGVITTLYFLLQTIYHKLRFLIPHKSSLKNHNIVIYSEGKKYQKVFLPILDEFEKREIPITFLTSSEDDPVFSRGYKYIDSKFIGSLNKALFKLAFLNADVCLMTTAGLNVFQLKRSKFVKHYSFMPHGIGDMCDYRMFNLDYYDSLLLVCDENKKYVREIEKKRNLKNKELVTVGAPSLDLMEEEVKKYETKKEKFTVLFSPSWGESSIVQKYGDIILEELSKKPDWDIIVRLHPQSFLVEKELVKKVQGFCSKFGNFYFDTNTDNMISMAKSDVMISDFSSIIFEFAFIFKKPVISSVDGHNADLYDLCWLCDTTWKFSALDKIGAKITKENAKNISSIIEEIKSNPKTHEIEQIREKYQAHQHNGAKNIVDFLIKKQKEVEDGNSL